MALKRDVSAIVGALLLSAPVLTTGALAACYCGSQAWNMTLTGAATALPRNFTFDMTDHTIGNMYLVDNANASVPYQYDGHDNFYFNATATAAPYQLYDCGADGGHTWLNLSSFGYKQSTNWDYGTNGADSSDNGDGWTDGYLSAKYSSAYAYSGSPFGDISVNLDASDSGILYDFDETAALDYGFRFYSASATGATIKFYTSEWSPTYSQHQRVYIYPTSISVTNGVAQNITVGEWYNIEFRTDEVAGYFNFTLSNSTWTFTELNVAVYQHSSNFVKRFYFDNQAGTGNIYLDDFWYIPNSDTTVSVAGATACAAATTTTTTLPAAAGRPLYGLRCEFISWKPLMHIWVR